MALLPAGTTALPGIHARLHQAVQNVLAHGATGDGVTNDRAAIQAADDAATASGDAVYFPAGTYNLGSALQPGGAPWIAPFGGVTFRGSNGNTTLVSITANLTDWHVEGIEFRSASGTTDKAFVSTSKYIRTSQFVRCNFTNLVFAFDFSSTAGFMSNVIDGGTSSNAPWSLKSTAASSTGIIHNTKFRGHKFMSMAQDVPAIEITSTNTSNVQTNNGFYGCNFESCDRQAILLRYHRTGTVEDCAFDTINSDSTNNPRDGSQKLPVIDLVDAHITRIHHNEIASIANAEFIGGSIASTLSTKTLTVTENRLPNSTPKVDLGQFSNVTFTGPTVPTWVSTPTSRDLQMPDRFIGARGRRGSAQSITTATWTTIQTDTETFDTDNILDSTTNVGRFTVPTGYGGRWRVNALGTFATNTTGERDIRIFKNNTTIIGEVDCLANGGATVNSTVAIDETVALVAGDFIEVQVQQTSGGNLNLQSGTGTTYVEFIRETVQ